MPTAKKLVTISRTFGRKQKDAAVKAGAPTVPATGIDWKKGTVTRGGGVAATVQELADTGGPAGYLNRP